MLKHEHFEQLCPLAAVGQLSGVEFQEFERHLSNCPSCRKRLQETRVLAEVLPAARRTIRRHAADFVLPRSPKGFREDFIARARREGIPLTAQSDKEPGFLKSSPFHGIPLYYGPLAASACVLILATLFFVYRSRSLQLQPQMQRADAKIGELTNRVSALQEQSISDRKQLADTEQTANTFSTQHAADLQRIVALQKLLADTKKQAGELQTSLASSQAGQEELKEKLADGSRELEQLKSGLERAGAARKGDQALLESERRKIDDLSDQLRLQVASADQERQLLTADRDIRDLMGARDLHIIDVHDFDIKGKRRKSFGRIFLTEGKSLIFYAFDLADPKLKNASFQAWGKREADDKDAVNLGIFYTDDQNQSRWVLKFDNPDVLREIDSVFVTVEPHGGRKHPSGQKLLFAYLNTDANHP